MAARLHPQKAILLRRRLAPAQYTRNREIRRAAATLLRGCAGDIFRRRCRSRIIRFLPIIGGFNHRKAGDISEILRRRFRRSVPTARFRTGHHIHFNRIRL